MRLRSSIFHGQHCLTTPEEKSSSIHFMMPLLSEMVTALRNQHEVDLHIYQSAHQNSANRILHSCLIPLETLSCLLLLASAIRLLVQSIIARDKNDCSSRPPLLILHFYHAMGWTLGLTSLVLSPDAVGAAACTFHVVAFRWITTWQQQSVFSVSALVRKTLFVWTLSWVLQVGMGHWILEGNQPTVFANNMQDVSWLAMTQSVLIAWKS
jgi:uncharacterized membrane protein YGL010W